MQPMKEEDGMFGKSGLCFSGQGGLNFDVRNLMNETWDLSNHVIPGHFPSGSCDYPA